MSLVPAYEDSSNSSLCSEESSNSEEAISQTKEVASPKYKLPTPTFGEPQGTADELKASVFKNPFIEAENAKEAILQKHVKMVETKDNIVVINGKKICWNYRKGRCRFGHNCKFAHDSDIQKTKDQVETEKAAAIQNSVVCQSSQMGHSQYTQDLEQIQEDASKSKKRKRPGLTQGLVPSKKVIKNYLKSQSQKT